MRLLAHIDEGLRNLFSSRLRSILALLGILVGTTSVVAMISGGKLATSEALKQFKTLGTDLLAVTIKDSNDNRTDTVKSLSLSQVNGLTKVDHNILITAPYTQLNNTIQFEAHEITGGILGVTAEFADVIHVELERGRFISNLDDYNLYCVIGQTVYDQIKKVSLLNPIGQPIQLGKNICIIIGIAKPWPESSFIYSNVNESIMIPIKASSLLSQYAAINNVIMRLRPQADIDLVKSKTENYLHDELPNTDFLFRSAKELITRMAKQSEILSIFLGLIGGISLFVGGIGVMNIMLVSVVERQREIGIRRAVGATQSDIRHLFLIEAMMLSVFGGGCGAILGIIISYLIALFWHWSFTIFIIPPLVGFTVSVATGMFFGFYPAHKASQLDPIESLRSV